MVSNSVSRSQSVLCIDASRTPAVGVVAEIDGESIRVVERRELSLDGGAGIETLLTGEAPVTDGAEPPHQPVDFSAPFTNALFIIPPLEYLSVLLALPFRDSKQLNRIIEAEVQDIVPFDTNEFLLQHREVGKKDEESFRIHVSVIPKRVVRNALALCRARGVDPMVVSTPASVLQAIAELAPTDQEPTLYCYATERFCHLAFASERKVLFDRVIDRSAPYTNGAHGGSAGQESLLFRIKLELAAAELKMELRFSSITFVGSVIDAAQAEKELGRSVRIFREARMYQGSGETTADLAVWGALLAEDSRAGSVLTNFRIGEFAYRPPLKELLTALRILAPFVLLVLVLGATLLGVNYFLTQREIHALNKSVAEQIRSVAKDVPMQSGQEVKAITDATNSIEDELKDMGSPESVSPLEALALFSDAMPDIQDVTVDKLEIRGNKISVEGCAPDYGAKDQLENAFNKKEIFSSVKKLTNGICNSGKPNSIGFKFELLLKE